MLSLRSSSASRLWTLSTPSYPRPHFSSLCSHPSRPAIVTAAREPGRCARALRAALTPGSTGWGRREETRAQYLVLPISSSVRRDGSTPEGNPGRKGKGGDGRGRTDAGTPVYSHRWPYTRRLRTSAIPWGRWGGGWEKGRQVEDRSVTGAPKNNHGMEWVSAAPDWCFDIASRRCEGAETSSWLLRVGGFPHFLDRVRMRSAAHMESQCALWPSPTTRALDVAAAA
ncbi:hypothetical protein B0H14DRAFT_3445790 [Mycena olivaceomarginata]|nr:hypothetical protein B0H14DRAFT_3445790 [Mycena olivaceomarginata]